MSLHDRTKLDRTRVAERSAQAMAVTTHDFYDSTVETRGGNFTRATGALCPDMKRRTCHAREAHGFAGASGIDTYMAYVFAGHRRVNGIMIVTAISAHRGAMEKTVKFLPDVKGKLAHLVSPNHGRVD